MRVTAEFVTSAASAAGFPDDGLPEIALVGRSNVGKSRLINALVRQRLARTSATPGKTRLVNFYRIARGDAAWFYLADLPGYGYARGGQAAEQFEGLTRAYFGVARGHAEARPCEAALKASASVRAGGGAPAPVKNVGALLLIDARHPGLESDRAAWRWIQAVVNGVVGIVATKIDKVARGERNRAMRELESVFEHSVLPVSAVTGEGLDELWKLIDRLANSHNPRRSSRSAQTAASSASIRPPRPLKE